MADRIPASFRGDGPPEDVELIDLDHDAEGVDWWSGRVAVDCPHCDGRRRLDDFLAYGCTCGAVARAIAIVEPGDPELTWWCPLCSEERDAVLCDDPDECVRDEAGPPCGKMVCPECRAVCREIETDDVEGDHGGMA